ncbi:MAG: helix-turn-helix transcriptional regulator [Clostridia bacterium]|nr:helix-turn-helix transcriptional regulator [Clostridia bacterium]
MDLQILNKIFTTDFNIDGIHCPYRSWTADTRYNYLENPRRKNGLMLITDYPVEFQLPNGSLLQKNPGDIILLPKKARYTIRFLVPEGKTTHPAVINFRLTDLRGKEIEIEPCVLSLCKDDGRLLQMFQSAIHRFGSATPSKLKAKVYEILDEIFPITDEDDCCIGYINRHYTERFSIPELADKCAMCETAYRKRFKKLTGYSPVRYINALKIEKACQMLIGDDMRMQDISDFLGFYSLPYFYKVFKEEKGMTPNEYYQMELWRHSKKDEK